MWMPLMDYAMKTGVSLSTLRRHIKARKIQYKIENGKYLLFCDETADLNASAQDQVARIVSPTGKLERDLRTAHEEIAELKMLIAIYEEKLGRAPMDC